MSYLTRMSFYCAAFMAGITACVTPVSCKGPLGGKGRMWGKDGGEGGREATWEVLSVPAHLGALSEKCIGRGRRIQT